MIFNPNQNVIQREVMTGGIFLTVDIFL